MARLSGPAAFVISIGFVSLAAAVVFLRLWTRFYIIRRPGIEDYFVAIALCCSVALTVLIGEQVKYGMGQHIWTLTPEEQVSSLKSFYASVVVYYPCLGLTKISILLQYLHIFPVPGFKLSCWITLVLVIIYSLWALLGSVFACTPIALFWDKTLDGHCIDEYAMWFTNAGINIASDFVIILLPMPVLRNLSLPSRQKKALMVVFALGGCVCIVSILRLQSLVAISNSTDQTWDNPPAATWSAIESNIGLICACLPLLRPLASRYFVKVFSTYQPTEGSGDIGFRDPPPTYQLSGPTVINSQTRTTLSGKAATRSTDEIVVVTVLEQKEEKQNHLERIGKVERATAPVASTNTFVREIQRDHRV